MNASQTLSLIPLIIIEGILNSIHQQIRRCADNNVDNVLNKLQNKYSQIK